jgi:hypothetical protein
VAQVLADGTIGLDLGLVPLAEAIVFPDVLRMTSTAGQTAKITLALSGPAAESVRQVGLWDEKRGIVHHGLTLKAGEEARIALGLEAGWDAPSGPQQGALTVTVTLEDGSLQQVELPLALTVVAPDTPPSASPDPASTPTVTSGRPLRLLVAPGGALWRPLVVSVALLVR